MVSKEQPTTRRVDNSKKIKIAFIAGLAIIYTIVIAILYLVPQSGYGKAALYEALNDVSWVEGVEIIAESRGSTGVDFDLHVYAKIRIETAVKMIEQPILRKCTGAKDKSEFECSNPFWETPNSETPEMLCASATGTGKSMGISDNICVNIDTGELWFAHRNY